MTLKKTIHIYIVVSLALMLTGCSVTKFIPENEYLLNKVKLESEDKSLDLSAYEPYIKQRGNTKWFSSLRIPLATYSLAGKDSTKWINKTLKNIGEKPITLDSSLVSSTCTDLQTAMQNAGYLDAYVTTRTKITGKKKINLTYNLIQENHIISIKSHTTFKTTVLQTNSTGYIQIGKG